MSNAWLISMFDAHAAHANERSLAKSPRSPGRTAEANIEHRTLNIEHRSPEI